MVLALVSMALLLAAVITGAQSMSTGTLAAHALHLKVAITTILVGMASNVLAIMLVMAAERQIHELSVRVAELEAARDAAPGAVAAAVTPPADA